MSTNNNDTQPTGRPEEDIHAKFEAELKPFADMVQPTPPAQAGAEDWHMPTHEEIGEQTGPAPRSALEYFIWEYEPANTQASIDWRLALRAVVDEARKHAPPSPPQDSDAVRLLREALRKCAKERKQLIEGVRHADNEVGEMVDKHADEDPPEGCKGSPLHEDLRGLQAHLSGTAIDDDGEYMDDDAFDTYLSTVPNSGAQGGEQ